MQNFCLHWKNVSVSKLTENTNDYRNGSEITDAQINSVVKKIEAAGLKANISRGVERTVIGAIGDERKLEAEMLPLCRAWNRRCTSPSNTRSCRANRTSRIP